jgi:membrane-bound lytic murein transglycosylase B
VSKIWQKNFWKTILAAFCLVFCFGFLLSFKTNAGVRDEIETRNKQIEEIQRQIDAYQAQIDKFGGRAKTLSGEISRLNAKISQLQLEIKSLGLAIEQTGIDIAGLQTQIEITDQKIKTHRAALARYIQILNQTDSNNLAAMILKNSRLSNFFNSLQNLIDAQVKAKTTVVDMKQLKEELEQKQAELREKKEELEDLKSLQVSTQRDLETDKKSKDQLLKETKGQEAKYQQLVKQSEKDIQKIREQIFYLEQNGITVEEAIKYGQLAAIRADIRAAFLIAILEVESGLGKNVGTGNWLNDMYNCYKKLGKASRAEAEKGAFMEIVNKLGLDPNSVKVSREPNYGCGGALGPAQFLPTTWLSYEEEVAQLTGHNPPNPWNIEDAFMASAVKLARAGATKKTKVAETAAAKAYLSGNPKCTKSICNYYANTVLKKASEIEQNL